MGSDIWVAYTASCTGRLVASMCSVESEWDSAIHIHHDTLNPTVCSSCGVETINGLANDEGCDGALNGGAGFLERVVNPGECWLVRVGGFGADKGRGRLDISCTGSECPLSQPPVVDMTLNQFGNPVESTKNRFLSFSGGEAGRTQAIRVTFFDLPAPFNSWNGAQLWVQQPQDVSENPGVVDPSQAPGDPTFKAAILQCDPPFFMDWSGLGVVHVLHEGIVPGGIYHVQLIDQNCSLTSEGAYSDPLVITQAIWGDTLENCATIPCTPPEGLVTILDVLGDVDKFVNAPGAITKARAELVNTSAAIGGCVNLKVDIIEVLQLVDALLMLPYPFTPAAPLSPCDPPTCPNPLPMP